MYSWHNFTLLHFHCTSNRGICSWVSYFRALSILNKASKNKTVKLLNAFFKNFWGNVVTLVFPRSRFDLRHSLLSWSSNLSSFCYVVTTVLDDAPPGTQEYIMLRQDSIQSAELKKKESPFRAKCHEIFCCPLKQVHHKENTEPEGLCTTDMCFACFLSFFFLSLSYWLCIALWCAVCCLAPDMVRPPPSPVHCWVCSAVSDGTLYNTVNLWHSTQHPPASHSWNVFSCCHYTAPFWLLKLLAPVANIWPSLFLLPGIPEAAVSWGMTLQKWNNEKTVPKFLTLLHSIKLLHCTRRMLVVYLVCWSRHRLAM